MRRAMMASLFFVLAVTGCKKTVQNEVVTSSMREQFKAKGWPEPTINCPTDAHKDGDKFECPYTLADGQKGTVDIEIQGSSLSWKVRNLIEMPAVMSSIATEIKTQTGEEATLKCQYTTIGIFANGDVFTCPAQVGSAARVVELTVKDNSTQSLSWKLLPAQ